MSLPVVFVVGQLVLAKGIIHAIYYKTRRRTATRFKSSRLKVSLLDFVPAKGTVTVIMQNVWFSMKIGLRVSKNE